MLQLNKNLCVGCEACVNICPKHCITMKADDEGFFFPDIDETSCINCGLCNKVCVAEENKANKNQLVSCLAVISANEEQRHNSSSGGVFSLLSDYVLDNKGVVYGAAFKDNLTVHHIRVDNIEDMPRLRTSKYVQSHIDNAFSLAKKDLENGRLVLFTGTGCQIDALSAFLKKDYDNLIKLDVVCHGVPSELVWKKYLQNMNVSSLPISFRDKTYGWGSYSLKLGGKLLPQAGNPYMNLFLSNLSIRKSCYRCPSKGLSRGSDITLADFWGIDKIDTEMFDDKGTSLVMINSQKGQDIFDKISDNCITKTENIEDAIKYNPCIVSSASMHEARAAFFEDLISSPDPDISKLSDKYVVFYNAGLVQKSKIITKRLLRKILK